jgi:subtilisin-like proprotein convertase family protein
MLNRSRLGALLLALALVMGGLTGCAGDEGPAGEQGDQGLQGETGDQGPQGEDGEDGEDGATSLVESEDIDPGDECTHGGVQLNTGLDADGDGSLSSGEVESSTVVCYAANADCAGSFEITDLSGVDQRFFEGVQSDPIEVVTDSDGEVDVQFVNAYLDFEPTGNDGEYTVTPPMVGGPFAVAVIATNDCAIDTATFTIDMVEEAVTVARALHMYPDVGLVDVALTGETDALFTLDYKVADGPEALDPDTYEFDILDDNGDLVETTPAFDLNLGDANTLVAYPDANGDVAFTLVADDVNEAGSDIRLQVTNLDPNLSEVTLLNVASDDTTTEVFTDVAFGDSSGSDVVTDDLERIGLDTNGDGDANSIFLVDDAIEEGDTVSLFVFEGGWGPGILVQSLDATPATQELVFEATNPTVAETNDTSDVIDDTNATFTKDVTVAGCSNPVSYLTVDVDISHAYRGDVRLTLTSPDGTEVVLKESAFDGDDDIIGNYPNTLSPEGDLSDFAGETGDGTWSLEVDDTYPSLDDGTFNSFTLNLWCD